MLRGEERGGYDCDSVHSTVRLRAGCENSGVEEIAADYEASIICRVNGRADSETLTAEWAEVRDKER